MGEMKETEKKGGIKQRRRRRRPDWLPAFTAMLSAPESRRGGGGFGGRG